MSRRSNALSVYTEDGQGLILQLAANIKHSSDSANIRDQNTRRALALFLPNLSEVTINPTSRAVGWWLAAVAAVDAPPVIAKLQTDERVTMTPEEVLDFLVWSSSLPEWKDQPVIIRPFHVER